MGAPEVSGRAGEAPTITLRHPRRPAAASSEAEVMHFLVAKYLLGRKIFFKNFPNKNSIISPEKIPWTPPGRLRARSALGRPCHRRFQPPLLAQD